MDKSAIRNFSIEARKILMKSAETEAGFYGVTRKGCKNPIQKGNDFEVYETLAGTENRIFGADIKKRANLVEAVETLGFDQVIEETAYTWFNRIIAVRFMEVNGYLPTRVRVLSSETGSNTPDIVTQSLDVDLNMIPEELEKVQKAKEENRYDDAFRMLFVKQCNELNAILPGLFEKTDDYMELLLKLSYTSDGVVRMLIDTVAEDNFNVETEGQVEIIGWMYQYYNVDLKDDTFAKLKKKVKISKERLPAATQLFTPDWIVRYLVENSVGRVWIKHEMAKDNSVDESHYANEMGWRYYICGNEQDLEPLEIINGKNIKDLKPEDISCIDPCMGSGHMLVYIFDVLMNIYIREGYGERKAVFSILEHNIHGLDIDKRAYQLSYFALIMKARKCNRRFFKGKETETGEKVIVEPKVTFIDESNSINLNHLNFFGDKNSENSETIKEQINSLIQVMNDAKQYGSLVSIEDKYNWDEMKSFIENTKIDGQISFETLGIEETKVQIKKLIEIGEYLEKKYLVVVTNPPYMAISNAEKKLSDYVKNKYPNSKADMFAVFMERTMKMIELGGYQAMITQHAWMFLSSYEKLRQLIQDKTIINMVHLGARAFEEIGGEVVQTTSFVIQNAKKDDYLSTYCRLVGGTSQRDKEIMFLQRDSDIVFYQDQTKFKKIPGHPVAYWVDEKFYEIYEKSVGFDNKFYSFQGMITGSNEYYLRLWHEIDIKKALLRCDSIEDIFTKNVWVPYNKGGTYRKWYGNNDYLLRWEKEGKELTRARTENRDYYFKEGVTWSFLTTGDFSSRYFPNGYLWDVSGTSAFAKSTIPTIILAAYMNNCVSNYVLNICNPTLNYQVENILALPYIEGDAKTMDTIEELSSECIKLCKQDWDNFENSWDFKKSVLIPWRN